MTWPDDYINKVICGDCLEVMKGIPDGAVDLVVLDPPFDVWCDLPKFPYQGTLVLFTNWQNRRYVTDQYGDPKWELVWSFDDGRWVSNNGPRITHETILVYGECGDASVGDNQTTKPSAKGKSSIGRWRGGERVYNPKPRKHLNSVLRFPRNVSSALGCWSKPLSLMGRIIEWLSKPNDIILDPFAGSGTTLVAAKQLGRKYIGIEISSEYCRIAEQRLAQEELFG